MVRLALAALCAVAVSTSATVSAYRPGDEVCVVSPDNTCPLDKITLSKTDGSTLIYPGGKTRCAYDNWTNPKTNYTTNATFFFQVFPTAEKKEKKKLLLYLQGGGACVDETTCGFGLQCSLPTTTFNANARALSNGVLNRSEPTNLFNDWNIVHVPYCTGDIHIGSAVQGNKDSGIEGVFNRSECLKQNMSNHQNGYENAKSAFDWAFANFPEVDQLALSGSSAGALGAQIYAAYIAKKWKVEEKKTRYSVLADSYVGVVPEAKKPSGQLLNFYNTCSLPLEIPTNVVSNCLKKTGSVEELVSPIIKQTSYADWFYADSKGDKTQRQFYEIVGQGILGFPFSNMISPEAFYKNMTAILDSYKDDTAKISTWFEDGERHVFFTLNNWTAIVGTDGRKLGAVVSEILSATSSTPEAAATKAPTATSAAVSITTAASVAAVALAALAVW